MITIDIPIFNNDKPREVSDENNSHCKYYKKETRISEKTYEFVIALEKKDIKNYMQQFMV